MISTDELNDIICNRDSDQQIFSMGLKIEEERFSFSATSLASRSQRIPTDFATCPTQTLAQKFFSQSPGKSAMN